MNTIRISFFHVHFSDAWVSRYSEELAAFTGRYVLLEGMFAYEPPEPIDETEEGVQSVCYFCPVSAHIYDVSWVVPREQ